MNNPKIYGFCPAGCKWETVHRNEFDASKSAVPMFEDEADHTYHLTDKNINLLEENPYYDETRHFKVYDGTAGRGIFENQGKILENTGTWNVSLCATLYINGEAVATATGDLGDRKGFNHEKDIELHSITLRTEKPEVVVSTSCGHIRLPYTDAGNINSISCDVYIQNIGYPHTDGVTTTERVDGCENTRVYSIGFSKGFWQLGDIETALDEIIALQDALIEG